jgi:hypothetical protein
MATLWPMEWPSQICADCHDRFTLQELTPVLDPVERRIAVYVCAACMEERDRPRESAPPSGSAPPPASLEGIA